MLGCQIYGHEQEDRKIPKDETQTSDCVVIISLEKTKSRHLF